MSQIVDKSDFYDDIKTLIEQSCARAYQAVNFAMVKTYWQIGKRIVGEEQAGSARAGYGENLIEMLSEKLTKDFGKGFLRRNVFYMRSLYVAFPIVHALRAQLSWTHYRFYKQLFASQYRLVVPSEKALAKVVDDEIQHLKNENILQEKIMHYGKL